MAIIELVDRDKDAKKVDIPKKIETKKDTKDLEPTKTKTKKK